MSGSGKVRYRVNLTAKFIEALKPDAVPYLVKDTRTRGLVLRVAQSGEKSWDRSYRVKGQQKLKHASGGRYGDPGASLEEARARSNELTAAARQGVDLIAQELEAREAKARAMTLGAFTRTLSRASCRWSPAFRPRCRAHSSQRTRTVSDHAGRERSSPRSGATAQIDRGSRP